MIFLHVIPVPIIVPCYDSLTSTIKENLDRHAPLKNKTLSGNHAPFMTKEQCNAVMNRSRLKKS